MRDKFKSKRHAIFRQSAPERFQLITSRWNYVIFKNEIITAEVLPHVAGETNG
jgi:hypothetical protein